VFVGYCDLIHLYTPTARVPIIEGFLAARDLIFGHVFGSRGIAADPMVVCRYAADDRTPFSAAGGPVIRNGSASEVTTCVQTEQASPDSLHPYV
jgi:hypothetical protein